MCFPHCLVLNVCIHSAVYSFHFIQYTIYTIHLPARPIWLIASMCTSAHLLVLLQMLVVATHYCMHYCTPQSTLSRGQPRLIWLIAPPMGWAEELQCLHTIAQCEQLQFKWITMTPYNNSQCNAKKCKSDRMCKTNSMQSYFVSKGHSIEAKYIHNCFTFIHASKYTN